MQILKSFIECYTKKYFDYSTRSSRKEYISFIMLYGVINIAIQIIYIRTQHILFGLLVMILLISSLIPAITIAVRRLHDINRSGYYNSIIILVIFLVNSNEYKEIGIVMGLLYGCILIFLKGTQGPNKYGEEPKY